MSYQKIYVPKSQFDALDKIISTSSICFHGKLKGIAHLMGIDLAITGACGTGTGIGWASYMASEVVPLELYKGDLEPLEYSQHNRNSYISMKVKHNNKYWVLLGKAYTILPTVDTVQLSLFDVAASVPPKPEKPIHRCRSCKHLIRNQYNENLKYCSLQKRSNTYSGYKKIGSNDVACHKFEPLKSV